LREEEEKESARSEDNPLGNNQSLVNPLTTAPF
jgi:hypothetical protein